jgi:hypothetical protein
VAPVKDTNWAMSTFCWAEDGGGILKVADCGSGFVYSCLVYAEIMRAK